jgi:poly(A) polymerase
MIRAVKYAAATGCKLPLRLRWKIKAQSALLEPVSPSRLTEEILKIINSPAAARIVESLEAFGLYAYLQPQAARLMKENEDFRIRYLKGLAALGQNPAASESSAPGARLAALIRDRLLDFVDWDAGLMENYKAAFLEARQFVLPMNPPRVELDQAVRLVFGEQGMVIKKSRLAEWGRPRRAGTEPPPENAPAEGEPKRRRRRRKKLPPAGAALGSPEA